MGAETFNPGDAAAGITFSNLDKTAANPSTGGFAVVRGSHGRTDTSGSYFFQVTIDTLTTNIGVGFASSAMSLIASFPGFDANGICWYNDAYIGNGATTQGGGAPTYTTGDKVGCEWLPASGQVKLYKWISGAWSLVWTDTWSPPSGAAYPFVNVKVGDQVTGNFGESTLVPPGTATNWDGTSATPSVNVTGSQTLSRPTQSSTIAVRDTVTGAQTLSRPTQSSTIAVRDTVTGSQTLANPSQSSTTAVIDAVTGAQTLSRPTQTSSITTTGGVAVTGAQTLSAPTQTSTIAVTDAVTGAQTLSAPTQTSAVAVTDAVTGAQTLSRPTQSSTVAVVAAVTGAQTTSAPTQTSAIVVVPAGRTVTGAQTLSSPSQSGSIGVRVAVTGAQTLVRPSQTSSITSAQIAVNITGSQLLLPVTQTFTMRSRIWQSKAIPDGIWIEVPGPATTIWTDR
jgi:hypothetical protein